MFIFILSSTAPKQLPINSWIFRNTAGLLSQSERKPEGLHGTWYGGKDPKHSWGMDSFSEERAEILEESQLVKSSLWLHCV
jgi:hypothetical protein